MALDDDIKWFKDNFADKIRSAIGSTPLTIDLLCAVALQETGYIWRILRGKGKSTNDILRLCVGDTIDTPRRSAFPKNRAALVARRDGQQMFDLAHSLLVEMANATGIQSYLSASANPDKFCHGYGIFQKDLQFFKADPQYFLDQQWADFDKCLVEAVDELNSAVDRLGFDGVPSLTDKQLCYVAIVYNTGFGNFDESRGLKQGFKDSSGVYYGEHIWNFLQASKAVPTRGPAIAGATGRYRVVARPTLNLRGGPSTSFDVKSALDTGLVLNVVDFVEGESGKWALVDLEGDGVRDGFVFANFLTAA